MGQGRCPTLRRVTSVRDVGLPEHRLDDRTGTARERVVANHPRAKGVPSRGIQIGNRFGSSPEIELRGCQAFDAVRRSSSKRDRSVRAQGSSANSA